MGLTGIVMILSSLKSKPISTATVAESSALSSGKIGAGEAIRIIDAFQRSISSVSIKKSTLIRSALVRDIGIINLYQLEANDLTDLSQLALQKLHRFELISLDGKKAQLLKQFIGDIREQHLYLLEYPEGYVLSLNDELLAFRL